MSERFINPYVDYGFKKLFGTEENKELLISFLNAMIFNQEEGITNLVYKNVEQLGDIKRHRNCFFDVYCQVQDGSRFIVEMQNAKQDYFKDRSLFYATKPIRDQGEKGQEWNFRLENVYMVGVMNFKFPEDEYPEESFYHVVKLMDVVDQHVFYDKLTLIYLEMPKLKEVRFEPKTMRDKWLYALHSLCYTDKRPEMLQEAIFDKLYNAALLANMSEAQLYAYEESQKNMWDYYNTLNTAKKDGRAEGKAEGLAEGKEIGRAEGRAEGMAEGRAEGEAKAKRKIVMTMKAQGLDMKAICVLTNLTEDEINQL